MKRKFTNRNEPIAELVAATLRGKRILRSNGLEPRAGRLSPTWITSQTDRESIAGPKLTKKHNVQKATARNVTKTKGNPVVSESLAM